MKKIKLYIYPQAAPHAHDQEEIYKNTIPFSAHGIKEHCEIVSPTEAEYFYMGQFSDSVKIPDPSTFQFLKNNEKRHICDIEGDWLRKTIPTWLEKCTLTMNGVRSGYVERNVSIFTRPTFSYLLMDIIRNKKVVPYTFNDNLSFGFKGFPDPLGVRYKMLEACKLSEHQIKYDISFNNKWEARASLKSRVVADYCKLLLNNTFSLCPRGSGVDSVRFFESCFFSRIPVVISDCQLFGYDYHLKNPFYFQINPNLSVEEMSKEIQAIQQTPEDVLKEMSHNAKTFFEEYVRKYFQDPTISFIKWKQGEKQ